MQNILNNFEVQDISDKEKRNYIIVFDIDGTLCKNIGSSNIKSIRPTHPECSFIPYVYDKMKNNLWD